MYHSTLPYQPHLRVLQLLVNSSAGAGNTDKGLAHAKPYRRVRVTSDQAKVVQGERGLQANKYDSSQRPQAIPLIIIP